MDEPRSHNKRPPGLRGKAIGLYYRDLQKKKKQEQKDEKKLKLGPNITVPMAIIEKVTNCLFKSTIGQLESNKISSEFEDYFRTHIGESFEDFINKSDAAKLDWSVDSKYSEKLKENFLEKCYNADYQQRLLQRKKLPALIQKSEILKLFLDNQILLIVGSTGCGKSTQVPQIILDHFIELGRGAECRIVCTQPRRISAISLSERVAYERCETLGGTVGYQIRLESKMPRERGSILYCTTGILLQKMKNEPLMHDVNVIVLDEIHERSVDIDILMGLLKKILPRRPDLKVILMSATVSEDTFRAYFNNCSTLQIDGTLFPVDVVYLEDILQETGFSNFQGKQRNFKHGRGKDHYKAQEYTAMIEPYIRQLPKNYSTQVLQSLRSPESEGCANILFLEHLIYHISETNSPGAILVFLPGYDKISKLQTALENPSSSLGKQGKSKLQIWPLHSMMPTLHQQQIFKPAPPGMRKVILSTILAETSVTIDDVVYVINTGRTKLGSYNIQDNIKTLEEAWITIANFQQRKGRAGRVQPGICFNLYTRAREARMDEQPTPEIKRERLETIILSIKLLHINDVLQFFDGLIDAPSPVAVQNAIQFLKRMEALDDEERLTPLGMHLANLPIEPQTGKMLLMSALFRCLDPISSAAAALSFKSPFYTPLDQESRVDKRKHELADDMKSDHLLVHNVLAKYRDINGDRRNFCYDNFLSISTLQQLENMKGQFADMLYNAQFIESPVCVADKSNINSNNIILLRAIIAAGLYPNMAQLHKARQVKNRVRAIHNMSTPEERRVQFHPSSVNSGEISFDSYYFVYFLKQKSSAVYLLDATMVFPMALLIFGDHVESGCAPNGQHYISVGRTYKFACDTNTSEVILQLRQYLRFLLQKKALHPSAIAENSADEQIIKAINILLSLDGSSYDMCDEMMSLDDDSDFD